MAEKITAQQLTLYFKASCPYCHRVFDALAALGYPVDLAQQQAGAMRLKDTQEEGNRDELIAGGGKKQVPCLAIAKADGTTTWLYESLDIIDFLNEQLAN